MIDLEEIIDVDTIKEMIVEMTDTEDHIVVVEVAVVVIVEEEEDLMIDMIVEGIVIVVIGMIVVEEIEGTIDMIVEDLTDIISLYNKKEKLNYYSFVFFHFNICIVYNINNLLLNR